MSAPAYTFYPVPLGQNLPWYEFPISLSGVRYTLEVRYNTRLDRWFLNISDAAGAPVLMGIPLLLQRNLTAQYNTLAIPTGLLGVLDKSGKQKQPGLSSFLTDHVLLYGDPDT